MIGVASDMTDLKNTRKTYNVNKTSYLYYSYHGKIYYNGSSIKYSQKYTEKDELIILLDMYNGELRFIVNGEDRGLFIND